MKYELETGDTKEYTYGVASLPVVHGKVLERFFNVIYCEGCGKQIKAKLMKCHPKDAHRFPNKKHQYRLISSKNHNDAKFCDVKCKNRKVKKKKLVKKRDKRFVQDGFRYTKPNRKQNDNMVRYLMSL